jgi:hypothetical protein
MKKTFFVIGALKKGVKVSDLRAKGQFQFVCDAFNSEQEAEDNLLFYKARFPANNIVVRKMEVEDE